MENTIGNVMGSPSNLFKNNLKNRFEAEKWWFWGENSSSNMADGLKRRANEIKEKN